MNTQTMLAIFKRDFLGYFSSPLGYVFVAFFVVATAVGAFLYNAEAFFANNAASLDFLNSWYPWLMVLFAPAISMSSWAEERKQATDELLFTLPATDNEIVFAKFLACFGIYTVALGFTLSHVAVLAYLGNPDLGLVFSTYVGYWLLGAAMIAIAMIASALVSNLTVAFLLGMALCGGGVLTSLVLEQLDWGPLRLLAEFGTSTRFESFGRGVVALEDVLYFLVLTWAALYANAFFVAKRRWRPGRAAHVVVRLCAIVVGSVSLVLVTQTAAARVDVTAEQMLSLSPEARAVVDAIPTDTPVYVQAWLDPDPPGEWAGVRDGLLRMLDEFDALGGERIQVAIYDTKPYTPQAQRAKDDFGIEPRTVTVNENGVSSRYDLFLGLAFTCSNREEVIKFFHKGLPVQYELTRAIGVVSERERAVVGVLETEAKIFGEFDFQAKRSTEDWQILEDLRRQYRVERMRELDQRKLLIGEPTLKPGAEVDAQTKRTPAFKVGEDVMGQTSKVRATVRKTKAGELVVDGRTGSFQLGEQLEGADSHVLAEYKGMQTVPDVLLVPQLSSLPQEQLDALEEYFFDGGKALILDDTCPMFAPTLAPSQADKPPQQNPFGPPQPPPSPKGNFDALYASLGLVLDKDKVLWDEHNPYPKYEEQFPDELVFVVDSSGDGSNGFNQEDAVTEGLEEVVLIFPGELHPLEGRQEGFTPLLWTSAYSGSHSFDQMIENHPFFGPTPKPPESRSYVKDDTRKVLAARVKGKAVASANRVGMQQGQASTQEFEAIVVADMDFVSDGLYELRKQGEEFQLQNVTFVGNCIDSLAGEGSYIALRKRQARHRTLTRLEGVQEELRQALSKAKKDAEEKSKEELEKAQKRLEEALEKIRSDDSLDRNTKAVQLQFVTEREQRKLNAETQRVEKAEQDAIEKVKTENKATLDAIKIRILVAALVVPLAPVLFLGLVVLIVRKVRESAGTAAARRR
ncbi:MAG: Gldg family protein [Planctomycetes bacterium]|nr:Gldg family protein [Planctomycetota bacterium]